MSKAQLLAKKAAEEMSKTLKGIMSESDGKFTVITLKQNRIVITPNTVNSCRLELFTEEQGRIALFDSNPMATDFIMAKIKSNAHLVH